MYDPSMLGSRLYKLRRMRKQTLEEFSEMLDVSCNFIGLVEKGKRSFSVETLCRAANALEVSLDSLLKSEPSADQRAVMLKDAAKDLSEKEFTFLMEILHTWKSYKE